MSKKNKSKSEELNFYKIIEATNFKIDSIRSEYNELLKKTQKKKKSLLDFDFELLGDVEVKQLYLDRKDEKYASLVVELYAIIEQALKKFYKLYNPNKQYRNNSKDNVILDLEKELIELEFKNNTKLLADLRKYIIHENYSLKFARKKVDDADYKNNKKLFKKILEDAEKYVNSIKEK